MAKEKIDQDQDQEPVKAEKPAAKSDPLLSIEKYLIMKEEDHNWVQATALRNLHRGRFLTEKQWGELINGSNTNLGGK